MGVSFGFRDLPFPCEKYVGLTFSKPEQCQTRDPKVSMELWCKPSSLTSFQLDCSSGEFALPKWFYLHFIYEWRLLVRSSSFVAELLAPMFGRRAHEQLSEDGSPSGKVLTFEGWIRPGCMAANRLLASQAGDVNIRIPGAPLSSNENALICLYTGELALTGKVLGISGVVKGLVAGNWQAWRFSLLAGLIAGGAALCQWYPHAFDPASTLGTLSTLRLVTAGNLPLPASTPPQAAAHRHFWFSGAALGNGCTSGHGISGNARLSVRSLAATLTFMVFGVASASFFDTGGNSF
eukprot:46545-Pelagomonas_calceolata.AAC.3